MSNRGRLKIPIQLFAELERRAPYARSEWASRRPQRARAFSASLMFRRPAEFGLSPAVPRQYPEFVLRSTLNLPRVPMVQPADPRDSAPCTPSRPCEGDARPVGCTEDLAPSRLGRVASAACPTLGFDGTNEPLCMCIEILAASGQSHCLHAGRLREGLPGHPLAPKRRMVDAVFEQNALDRVASNFVPEIAEGTSDSRVAPSRTTSGHEKAELSMCKPRSARPHSND